MTTKIGNNNKIKKSIIGNNNTIKPKEKTLLNKIIEIIIGLVITVIGAYIIYKLGWN